MDVHSLSQTPFGIFSLVLCGVVAAYAFSVLLRMALNKLSAAALPTEAEQTELLMVHLTGRFREQLTSLFDKVHIIERLFAHLPQGSSDSSWEKLLRSCDALKLSEEALMRLLNQRDFVDGLQLARFLTGTKVTIPTLKVPFTEQQLSLLIQWRDKTTLLLQRMVAKIEDALQAQQQPPSDDFLNELANLRKAIISEEERGKN
jgi:hypothetical protein